MKANELMIGDLVYYSYLNQFVTKVIDVCSHGEEPFIRCQRDSKDKLSVPGKFEDFHVDILRPILLTTEILEKNGWILKEFGCHKQFQYSFEDYDTEIILKIDYEKPTFIVSFFRASFELKYVNELQHALKLCGIEKEIVL